MPILHQTFTEASVHLELLVLFDITFSFATFMYIFRCSLVRDRGNGFDHYLHFLFCGSLVPLWAIFRHSLASNIPLMSWNIHPRGRIQVQGHSEDVALDIWVHIWVRTLSFRAGGRGSRGRWGWSGSCVTGIATGMETAPMAVTPDLVKIPAVELLKCFRGYDSVRWLPCITCFENIRRSTLPDCLF